MLPGYISGFYSYDEVHIDLSRLARFAGARLIHAEARGLDTQVGTGGAGRVEGPGGLAGQPGLAEGGRRRELHISGGAEAAGVHQLSTAPVVKGPFMLRARTC